jgi:hypothetical protein
MRSNCKTLTHWWRSRSRRERCSHWHRLDPHAKILGEVHTYVLGAQVRYGYVSRRLTQ